MTSPVQPPSSSHAPDSANTESPSAPTHVDGHAMGSHTLGPHVVGQRVVVRRILPGVTGPSGGPAFTDTLGDCITWGEGRCVVRTAAGDEVTIELAHVVSGKPVPPRPSVRLRVPPQTLHLRSQTLTLDVIATESHGWILRRGGHGLDGRTQKRGNSALAVAEPTTTVAQAAAAAAEFYSGHGARPLCLVIPGSAIEQELHDLGWVAAGGAAEAMVAPLSRMARLLPSPSEDTELKPTLGGPGDDDVTVSIADTATGDTVARGRAVLDTRDGETWVTISDVMVAPERRRQGLAQRLLAEITDWAASQGAITALLQVQSDNAGALALYSAAGFSAHHEYRFVELPS